MQPTPAPRRDARIPPKSHDGKPDLDPTEWKPSEPESDSDNDHTAKPGSMNSQGGMAGRPKMQSRDTRSEGFVHLSRLHRSAESAPAKRRPGTGATPPLSHASTVTASSPSTDDSLAGTPYSFINNPPVSVPTTPITTVATATTGPEVALAGLSLKTNVELRGIDYGKKTIAPGSRSARGSLKKLLAAKPDGAM
ncbi:MAG: hypothetical protein Q9163_000144 [Psora crenata]